MLQWFKVCCMLIPKAVPCVQNDFMREQVCMDIKKPDFFGSHCLVYGCSGKGASSCPPAPLPPSLLPPPPIPLFMVKVLLH